MAVGVVAILVLGVGLAVWVLPPSGHDGALALRPSATSSQQWAFGGSASASYSCSNSDCYSSGSGETGNLTLSYRYYIEWVVIYTETNVSASQTQIEGQVALNASVSFSLSSCVVVTTGSPCVTDTASLSFSGRESAIGFTNLTSGDVNLTAAPSGPLGSTPAWAISNASSSDSFNFSGSLSVQGDTSVGTESESASLDFGGSESASIAFAQPIGVVPLNPVPGDAWQDSASYTGHGSFVSGAMFTYQVNGSSGSYSNWTSGAVSPSGLLNVNGTDLGASTLWDNYTTPPTSVSAQEIELEFRSGGWTASDGYLMIPTGLYSGALAGLSAGDALVRPAPSHAVAPSTSSIAAPGGESVFFEKGVGFVGAGATASESIPGTGSGVASPTVRLQAGPEPVSVAEGQYSAILSSGSSSSGLSSAWLIVGIVVVVAVLLVAALLWRRSRKPTAAAPLLPVAPVPGLATQSGGPAASSPPPAEQT